MAISLYNSDDPSPSTKLISSRASHHGKPSSAAMACFCFLAPCWSRRYSAVLLMAFDYSPKPHNQQFNRSGGSRSAANPGGSPPTGSLRSFCGLDRVVSRFAKCQACTGTVRPSLPDDPVSKCNRMCPFQRRDTQPLAGTNHPVIVDAVNATCFARLHVSSEVQPFWPFAVIHSVPLNHLECFISTGFFRNFATALLPKAAEQNNEHRQRWLPAF